MRFEDKDVDGREVGRAEELMRDNELEKEDELDVPALDLDKTLDGKRESQVIIAMRAILEHRQIIVNDLQLPQRELLALEALKAAVEGRDGELSQFVYASDRSDLLEQALAILQPSLIEDLDQPFQDLIDEIGALRGNLKDLEDAQDELLEGHQKEAMAKGDGDTADKPKPKPRGDDDVSLTGPERKIAKPGSQLEGPDVKEPPKSTSTLDGPEMKEPPKPASTLGGPEVKDAPKPKSTLDGPAIDEAGSAPSTLGTAEELGAAATAPEPTKKKPWWKRPFGG